MKRMTLTEMKQANKAIGHYWFSRDTMKYWNTRVEAQPNKYNLFIASNQPDTDDKSILFTPRKYQVVYFNSNTSKVTSVTTFDSPLVETLEKAKQVREAITKALDNMGNREEWIMDNLSYVEYTPDWLTFVGYDGEEYRKFDISYDGRICG